VNIEELELSLRSEFEGQLNSVVARLRQDVADFQEKFQAEFQKHREQMDRSIDELATRLPESYPLESAFKSTITEHLRLARDEGAQIAATAFGEAEKLKTESASGLGEARYDFVRDAINDITSRRSQAAILTALVEHAAHFAPRGAFFIVKNDNFVGWKGFGANTVPDEAVREIRFTTKCNSALSEAVGLLSTVSTHFGAYADDCSFLEPLGYGQPAQMYAIPLSARGRGVAVLYADKDSDGSALNVEALETLVRVAGLTVELLAAQSAKPQAETAEKTAYSSDVQAATSQPTHEAAEAVSEIETAEVAQTVEEVREYEPEASAATVEAEMEPEPATETVGPDVSEGIREDSVPAVEYEFETTASAYETETDAPTHQIETTSAYEFESTAAYEPVAEVEEPVEEAASVEAVETSFEPAVYEPVEETKSSSEFEFASNSAYDATAVETAESGIPHVEFAAEEVSVVSNGNGYVHTPEPAATPVQPEPVAEVASAVQAAKPRLSDRNVDLPIEVADEERKLHNDARRFARLLVSEIKLYNEQQVVDGREHHDLYDRLREAIDRSREMYEKRVKPAVASKFDYFHYELVNGLAEGDVKKLGGKYPGGTV
jgi:hypothetical protein